MSTYQGDAQPFGQPDAPAHAFPLANVGVARRLPPTLGVAMGIRERSSELLELVQPTTSHLPGYVAALEREWSPDNVRGVEAAKEELEEIRQDPTGFVRRLTDREAKGPPVVLPDGSSFPRLPGYRLWLWDGEFCGSIGFRWQPGTSELPAHVLGHIGYAVVPWKRRRGYATRALGLLLPYARNEALQYVEITAYPDNVESQKVILANGGVLIERFKEPVQYGGHAALRFRIPLQNALAFDA